MLEAAHRGYAYQDLLVATRLVDVLLGEVAEVIVDKKLVRDDRFDDLTTVEISGARERTQIKDQANPVPLALNNFTTEVRSLRLDSILSSALVDRNDPGAHTRSNRYRIVMRDRRPTDPLVLRLLRRASSDPGPFVSGMTTLRLAFDPEVLWPTATPADPDAKAASDSVAFLRNGRFTREDIVWFCTHAIVEVEAPSATIDLTHPGQAERLLIDRANRDIGAGSYPNIDRSPLDVAAALVRTVLAARAGRAVVSVDELLRRAQLRKDFGAVARAHPIEAAVEVVRQTTIDDVVHNAESAADEAVPLLVIGPPGQGKSWACQRVQDRLRDSGWLVGEHYCFLGDADEDRQTRVHSDRVIGSLLGRLADAEPSIVAEQRPRFSADDRALVAAVVRARDRDASRRIALLVDGIDHVTRVLGATTGRMHPSALLAERLAALGFPAGSVLIVFSQPGEHLRTLHERGALTMDMPGLGRAELRQLAERWKVLELPLFSQPSDPTKNIGNAAVNDGAEKSFLDALVSRSSGNALYATYLCREVLRSPTASIDPAKTLLSLPDFDGTLGAYYQHLCSGLGDGAWVADIVALLDFSVSRAELKDMRPDLANRIDAALDQLGPVLAERAMQGGIRVYHESFARFWLATMANDPPSILARLTQVADWLNQKGLFKDGRAFRFLLPTLARAKKLADVVALIDTDFASKSVAAGFNASAIRTNLATGVACAARTNDWPAIVRCIELSRAADAFEFERLDNTVVEFADVAMAVLGPQTFAARLLYDGRTTLPARAGIKLCEQIDIAGGTAPWSEYVEAYYRERKDDNVSYGDNSERQVATALLRGQLRLADFRPTDAADLQSLADSLDEAGLAPASAIDALFDTLGAEGAVEVVMRLKSRGAYALRLAERLTVSEVASEREQAFGWAEAAVNDDGCAGDAHRFMDLGVPVADFVPMNVDEARDRLLQLTRQVQEHGVQFEPRPVLRWLDACVLAARRDHLGLATAEALLSGEGWYRCWLRFVVSLCRAEAQPAAQRPEAALNALKLLTGDLRPFIGDPRACDLYRLQGVISSTIRRALTLVTDALWSEATQILVRVCDEISTTIYGEMSGPLARDTLLELIVGASKRARYETSAAVVSKALADRAGRTYYADVAGFHLAAARLSLRSDARDQAAHHWESACRLLVSYGFHKDTTIYELLDPLEALIPLDTHAAQKRLEVLQPLCERILFHTDGKETRHARPRWWALLAAADPMGLALLASPELLRRCNMPHDELEQARADLWREQCQTANPVVGSALRLSLQIGLDEDDSLFLDRLAAWQCDGGTRSSLLQLLIARADERPTRYSYSNSAELLRTDDERVTAINEIAMRMDIPPVFASPIPTKSEESDSRTAKHPASLEPNEVLELILSRYSTPFDRGVRGLASAINLWRNRPYRATEENWSPGRFANAIGYRLIELLEQGRDAEADLTIAAIADAMSLGSDYPLLAEIGKGLERHQFHERAVLAYTLNWTRTRGHGGWLNFGGETQLDSLRQAARISGAATLSILATEVERVVRGSYGTLGVSQALILALGIVDWGGEPRWPSGQTSVHISFAAWDEAANVIATRLPRVDPMDDPDVRYVRAELRPAVSDSENVAMTIATFAGLSHPSREQKRRSLLAITFLMRTHPALAAEGLALSLAHLTEPGTLSWLLAVVRDLAPSQPGLLEKCEDELRRLCASLHLTIRTLARDILMARGIQTDAPPFVDPVPELTHDTSRSIWTPECEKAATERTGSDSGMEGKYSRKATMIVRDAARVRITAAETMLPRFGNAVIAEVTRQLSTKSYEDRLRGQLERLTSRAEFRWPDAFIGPYEVAEQALQRVAGGGRSARALAGEIMPDPTAWESRLAQGLLNDPRVPLAFESIRIPRPSLPSVPPGYGDPIWNQITAAVGSVSEEPSKFPAVRYDRDRIAATTFLDASAGVPVVSDGPYKGWRAIAIYERRISSRQPSWPAKDAVTVTACGAIELRQPKDTHGLTLAPLGDGDLKVWFTKFPLDMPVLGLDHTGPLITIDTDSAATTDGMSGLGYVCAPLAPSYALLQKLALQPGNRLFELVDQDGSLGMVSRNWRTNYVVSDYEMNWPTLYGTDLIVRPDVFGRIMEVCGANLMWREHVEAHPNILGRSDSSSAAQ